MMDALKVLLFLIMVSAQAACNSPTFNDLVAFADSMAAQANLQQQIVSGGRFNLHAYVRVTDPARDVTVYIEGDGKAWVTRNRWSLNPTPHDPQALKLAVSDSISSNVIYLARPCQYRVSDQECTPEMWTSRRYSAAVVESIHEAITAFTQQYAFPAVNLVGYSGGGTLAVLVAVKRTDVRSIRTVAANLNTDMFTRLHKVTPMKEIINPLAVANQTKSIAQLHFVGAMDRVVPSSIAHSYLEKVQQQDCIKIVKVEKISHNGAWEQQWVNLLQLPLPC